MRKIGHHPGAAETVEGWSFRRCRCGFVLGLSDRHRTWWIRASSPPVEVTSLTRLFEALATECRYHRPRAPVTAANPALAGSRAQMTAAPLKSGVAPAGCAGKSIASKTTVVVKPRNRAISTSNG
jgi:hypothetical protein